MAPPLDPPIPLSFGGAETVAVGLVFVFFFLSFSLAEEVEVQSQTCLSLESCRSHH